MENRNNNQLLNRYTKERLTEFKNLIEFNQEIDNKKDELIKNIQDDIFNYHLLRTAKEFQVKYELYKEGKYKDDFFEKEREDIIKIIENKIRNNNSEILLLILSFLIDSRNRIKEQSETILGIEKDEMK